MSGWHWMVVVCLCQEALFAIIRIGKPRKAYTPGETAFEVVYWLGLALAVVLG